MSEPQQLNLYTLPRSKCPKCSRMKSVYCDICVLALDHTPPSLELPVHCEIWRHPVEKTGKTTTTHVLLISPSDSSLFLHNFYKDGMPDELSRRSSQEMDKTLLLFPSDDSVSLDEIDKDSFNKVIVLDGTWSQAKSMAKVILESTNIRTVKIDSEKTRFWRYQSLSDGFLATIEAIYYFYQTHAKVYATGVTFEKLLYYFDMQYQLIQQTYKENPDKSYTKRKMDSGSYIKY